MALRTSEQLKELFQLNKERRQRQQQLERERKKKEREEKYKRLTKLADKLLREEKEKKMEELQALAKKCSQKPLNEVTVTRTIKIYNSNLIEREPNDRDLYTTREELMAAEERGEGEINWSKFDQLVDKVRKQLCTILI